MYQVDEGTTMWMCYLQIVIYLFIYYFIYLIPTF